MGFLEILNNPLLAEHILHQVDALSLSSLQRTSQSTKAHVEAHYAHSFRRLLARYFDDVDGFLYLLQRIEGCITGSQALKVIMNDASASWEAQDLDISIPQGSKCTLCSYLETFESYKCNECEGDGKVWSEERLGYHQMLKRQRLKSVTKLIGRRGQRIDILESNTCNCIAPLCEFHSTAVINALFPNRMTCFFPNYTLRYRSIPNALYQREKDHRSVAKYTGRGWQPIPHAKAILEEEVLLANTWNIDVSCVPPPPSSWEKGKKGEKERMIEREKVPLKDDNLQSVPNLEAKASNSPKMPKTVGLIQAIENLKLEDQSEASWPEASILLLTVVALILRVIFS